MMFPPTETNDNKTETNKITKEQKVSAALGLNKKSWKNETVSLILE